MHDAVTGRFAAGATAHYDAKQSIANSRILASHGFTVFEHHWPLAIGKWLSEMNLFGDILDWSCFLVAFSKSAHARGGHMGVITPSLRTFLGLQAAFAPGDGSVR
jgi:hypothetical protein